MKFKLPFLLVSLVLAAPAFAEAHFGFFRPAPRFVHRDVVVVSPSFVPVAVTPQLIVAPSAGYAPVDPNLVAGQAYGVQAFDPSIAPLYSAYAAGCAAAQVQAVPLEVFSANRAFFRGDARDFNLRVGPFGFVHGRVGS